MSVKRPAVTTVYPPHPPTPYPVSPVSASVLKAERAQSASGHPSVSMLKRRPASSSHISSTHESDGVTLRRRRIKSAVEERKVANLLSSNSPWANKKWAQSSYSFDYALKKPYPPPTIRPASATRRNNPHPSEVFMIWQFPSRIHPHDRAVAPKPGAVNDLQERFYADYLKNDNKTGGAKYEVPITNVAKIPFPGNASSVTKESASQCTCDDHGTQKSTSPESRVSHKNRTTSGRVKETSIGSKIYQQTFTPPSYKAFQEWAKSASSEEKKVLLSLLQAANSKEAKMQKLLGEVFNPSSLEQIEKWLTMLDINEYNKVLHILEQLADGSRQHRRVPATLHKVGCRSQKSKSCAGLGGVGGNRATHSLPKLSVVGSAFVKSQHHVTLKSCIQCGRKMTDKSKLSNQSDLLWHHRIKPPQTTKVFRTGAIFGQPNKARGQHYALHPEWPIA